MQLLGGQEAAEAWGREGAPGWTFRSLLQKELPLPACRPLHDNSFLRPGSPHSSLPHPPSHSPLFFSFSWARSQNSITQQTFTNCPLRAKCWVKHLTFLTGGDLHKHSLWCKILMRDQHLSKKREKADMVRHRSQLMPVLKASAT